MLRLIAQCTAWQGQSTQPLRLEAKPMMKRLPSIGQLDRMSSIDRFRILDVLAHELRSERDGILSGWITPWNGATRASILTSNRRRLQRLRSLADEFEIALDHVLE